MSMSKDEKDQIKSLYKPSTENVILETYMQDNTVHVKTSTPELFNHDFAAVEQTLFHNSMCVGLWFEDFVVQEDVWHKRGSVVPVFNNDVLNINPSSLCQGRCMLSSWNPDRYSGVMISVERLIQVGYFQVYTPREFDTLLVDYRTLNGSGLETDEIVEGITAWQKVFQGHATKAKLELEFAEQRITATHAFIKSLVPGKVG